MFRDDYTLRAITRLVLIRLIAVIINLPILSAVNNHLVLILLVCGHRKLIIKSGDIFWHDETILDLGSSDVFLLIFMNDVLVDSNRRVLNKLSILFSSELFIKYFIDVSYLTVISEVCTCLFDVLVL